MLSAAGDINGDGINDVVVGACWISSYTGMAYVVFGGRDAASANINMETFQIGPTLGFRILAALREITWADL